MYSEPCARFTRSMMPKVSVSPAASRNISRPSCTPFSTWISRYSIAPSNETGALTRSRSPSCPCGSLHRALFVVGILGGGHRGGDRLDRHGALRVLHRLLDVEVLDRELVGVELEVAAQRLEVGLLQLRPHLVLVGQVALQRLGRRGDQHDRVVALRAVVGRVGVVLLLEVRDVALVLLVRQV